MARVPRDDNFVTGILVLGSATGSDVVVEGDESTKGMFVQIVGDDVGIGGGTQYTEDAAAAANPAGNAQILVRADTPAGITTTDGDNVARRGTDYGAAFSQILDSSGNFVDTFGGGTQYTEGDTDATITGTALMFEGVANALVAATGTAANGLDVDVTRVSGTVTVDGSGVTQPVSATSLPLPSGAATSANQLADSHGVVPKGATAGGGSTFNSTDLDESEEEVKGTAGTIYSLYAWNLTAAPLWLKAFNATAANVTVGSTSADYDIMIPANADSDGAGFVIPIPTGGWPFSTAITLAITTGVGATNSGAPAANDAGVLVFYT